MTHILFVDDDLELQTLVKELLMIEGFTVSVCSNGNECLDFLTHTRPDIIILDVMMPKRNGWDTLKELRKDHPNLPVIMLSAKGDSVDRILGLELGADDYISKPFDDRELIARIRARMRIMESASLQDQPKEVSSDLITVDGLEFNKSQLRLTFEGKNLNLTSTEFSLLYYMAANRGKTITRDELSRKALGKRHQAFDRVIDMHLSNIRKKLPPRPSHLTKDATNTAKEELPWFKTVHGQGYLFIDS